MLLPNAEGVRSSGSPQELESLLGYVTLTHTIIGVGLLKRI